MEEEKPQHVVVGKLVSGRQLLEQVHIPQLGVERFGKLVAQTHKKPVLVKIVIGDVLARVDVYFIVEGEEK
jgi:hypothetical protein